MQDQEANKEAFRAPIAVSQDTTEVEQFIDLMRKGSVKAAALEAERLKKYFANYAQLTVEDLAALPNDEHRPEALATGEKLSEVFRGVGRVTRSAILSQWMIIPDNFLEMPFLKTDNDLFSYEDKLKGHVYRLGFVQVYEPGKNSAVTIPTFAIGKNVMDAIAPFKPEAMLERFQHIASAGNHDMQHHLSNTILNSKIARTTKPEQDYMQEWRERFGHNGDTHINSFESWLMLNHQRVHDKQLADGEERALRDSCDAFFDELERIGGQLSAATYKQHAHEIVDFFGTLACFTLMRYVRLDHPLLNYAVGRLRQADPLADDIFRDKDAIIKRVSSDKNEYVEKAFWNYAADNAGFVCKDGDYSTLKKLEVLMMAPWAAHLLSPAMPGSDLAKIKEKVAAGSLHLIWAAANNTDAGLAEGKNMLYPKAGLTIEKHIQNGKLHCETGPAVVIDDTTNRRKVKEWHVDGVLQKRTEETRYRTVHRKYKDGREAVMVHVSDEGTRLYTLKKKDGSSYKKEQEKSKTVRTWMDAKENSHHDGGPAYIVRDRDGSCTQKWRKHGEAHRIGGPAEIEFWPNGKLNEEKWMEEGQLHRVDGPCLIQYNKEGEVIYRQWRIKGEVRREGGPAIVNTRDKDKRVDTWFDRDGNDCILTFDRQGQLSKTTGVMTNDIKAYYAAQGCKMILPPPQARLAV